MDTPDAFIPRVKKKAKPVKSIKPVLFLRQREYLDKLEEDISKLYAEGYRIQGEIRMDKKGKFSSNWYYFATLIHKDFLPGNHP
jgi:hypothetical protein